VAAYLSGQGVVKGEFVAVFTTNSPEMVITILALSKLGAVGALINTNLRGIFVLYSRFIKILTNTIFR
jgi:acyl-CoA synthetase (AMP-forming)/AMP-acid ligase II